MLLLLAACGGSAPTLTVFGAASTALPLNEAVDRWNRAIGTQAIVSTAASSVLARQIQAGAGADLFLSANSSWGEALGPLRLDRMPYLANELVVVGTATLDDASCIAVGDPMHVPAGQYAKASLEASGRWDELADRIVPTLDATAAVRMVQTEACPTGIVYRTDAALGDSAIIETLPSLRQIRYPLILLDEHGRGLFEWLATPEGRAPFLEAGFTAP